MRKLALGIVRKPALKPHYGGISASSNARGRQTPRCPPLPAAFKIASGTPIRSTPPHVMKVRSGSLTLRAVVRAALGMREPALMLNYGSISVFSSGHDRMDAPEMSWHAPKRRKMGSSSAFDHGHWRTTRCPRNAACSLKTRCPHPEDKVPPTQGCWGTR